MEKKFGSLYDLKIFRELYLQKSEEEIMRKLNISQKTYNYNLKKLLNAGIGIYKNGSYGVRENVEKKLSLDMFKLKENIEKEILEFYYREGYLVSEVAEILGYSERTIYRKNRKYGIKIGLRWYRERKTKSVSVQIKIDEVSYIKIFFKGEGDTDETGESGEGIIFKIWE
ncbi:MAG: hypothetical protein ACRC1R_10400 [Cetobacterium sp.]|uniref:hypothetical protein n=1 Tax=Cetobacterium sp. TaxID=2071632 RepID=UPI003F39E319